MQRLWLLTTAVIVAGALPAQGQATFATYHCRDGAQFVVAFYDGDKHAYIQLDGKAMTLSKRVALRGERYRRGDVTLRIAKNGATTLKRGKRTTECTTN